MGTREHQFGLAAASKTIGVHVHSFTAFFDIISPLNFFSSNRQAIGKIR
jgi:hypothetical protein